MEKRHTFKVGDSIVTWFDSGAFGGKILFGLVISAGPKMYRARWESGFSNRFEQGRTCCWLQPANEWKDWAPQEIQRLERRLGTKIRAQNS